MPRDKCALHGASHVDDAVMTSLWLMSRLLSLVARRFCRVLAER